MLMDALTEALVQSVVAFLLPVDLVHADTPTRTRAYTTSNVC